MKFHTPLKLADCFKTIVFKGIASVYDCEFTHSVFISQIIFKLRRAVRVIDRTLRIWMTDRIIP